MLKKSDPWEAGFKMVTKFFGFDVQQDQPQSKHTHGSNGILSFKQTIESSFFGQSQPRSYQLKQKWRKLMRFPSKVKHRQVVQLLRQGSAIEDETWIWMMKNSQKISSQLYSSRKQQFNKIVYSQDQVRSNGQIFVKNIQVGEFEQPPTLKDKNSQDLDGKKRKFSILRKTNLTKSQPLQNGRLSLTTRASTFSSQTNQSKDFLESQRPNQPPYNDYQQAHNQNCQIMMKSSTMSVCSSPAQFQYKDKQLNQVNLIVEKNQSLESQLCSLPQKINHPALTSIIGAFLLHREDFSYSVTLFNMAATFYYYTNSSEIKTFTLLNHVACSEFFVHYLTKNWEESGRIIAFIANRIRNDCPPAIYLRSFKLENFVQNWLFGFFYSLCQNGSQVKQKIIGYLLINNFSIESLVRVCQSLIFSLGRVISQSQQERIYDCLQNPKYYIDKEVLFYNLLGSQD